MAHTDNNTPGGEPLAPGRRTSAGPDKPEFQHFLQTAEPFELAVRGHQVLDMRLQHLVLQGLPGPHALEVSRLSFILKFDIAAALGVINPSIRPLFVVLNRIRNAYAHNFSYLFDRREAAELRNVIPDNLRRTFHESLESTHGPRDFLALVIAIAYTAVNVSLSRLVETKIYDAVIAEMAEEAVGRRPAPPEGLYPPDINEEVRIRCAQKLADAH